jgi:hypothetical protein
MSADNTIEILHRSGAVPVAALQTEVMSAVRGAISTVMAGQGNGLDLAGIDLDFAKTPSPAQLAVLLAKPDQALAVPKANRVAQAKSSSSRLAIAAAVIVAVGGAVTATVLQDGQLTQPPKHSTIAASVDLMPTMLTPSKLVSGSAPAAKADAGVTLAAVEVPVRTPTAVPATDAVVRARGLLDGGQVREARTLLLAAPGAENPDVAWLLARSFDANYLSGLGSPDATGDSAEARRWYERWFDRAKKKGSVDKTARLDRLLLSLK